MKETHAQRIKHIFDSFGVEDISGAELSRLTKLIATGYETIFKARMRDEGLSGPRWRILLHLFMAEEMGRPGVSPTELAQARNVSKNTVSTLLRSLEEQELISRTIAPHDRRSFIIQLTDKGRALVQERSPQHLSYLNELAGDLSPEEREQLITLLRKLYRSIARRGGLPEGRCSEQ